MLPELGHVVVTGSTGFVGRSLLARLGGAEPIRLGIPDWRERLEGAALRGAAVFHLAARVHGSGDDDESAYRRDNVDKTRVLAQAAAERGARRFVFLSSIKVNGEETAERPFRADDPPDPVDAYARSKWAAEQALGGIARETGLAVVIVRAPLVIGPGARGNLRALLRLADSPWPLPLGAIDNRRTMLHVEDLAALLVRCALAPGAPGRTWLAGDQDSVSTPRLVASMRRALGRARRLLGVPPALLEMAAGALGRGALMRRLTRSLEIDVAETMRELQWAPRIDFEAGVAALARAYRESAASR